jgi:MFS family permease
MIIGALGQTMVVDSDTFVLCRAVLGLGMGICLASKPIYVSELCSAKSRGFTVLPSFVV